MAPSPGGRGPAKGGPGGDRGARSLKAFAEEAERDRSDPQQLARLLERAAAGDAEALQRLFNENLALVLRLAHRLAGENELLSEDELVQEGSLALVSAIRELAAEGAGADAVAGFAPRVEERVTEMMRGAIAEESANKRADRQLVEDAEAYERAEVSIRRDKMREATLAELAEKLEWSEEKTRILGEMVAEARRLHDEDLLQYIEPDELSEIDDE